MTPLAAQKLDLPANSSDKKFYVYYLRRSDRVDPLDPDKGCPFYVGKGMKGTRRRFDHRSEAKTLLHRPGQKKAKIAIIHKLWRQGLDFIEDVLLDGLTEQEAFDIEIEAIEVYGRLDLGTGCLANLTNGGEGPTGAISWKKGKPTPPETREKMRLANIGQKRSEETRQKLRESHLGHTPSREAIEKSAAKNRGKKRPPEVIAKMSEGRKRAWEKQKQNGYKSPPKPPCTEETRQKLRESHLGKGHPHDEKARQKIREANLGAKNPNYGKPPSEETRRKISKSLRRFHELKEANDVAA